MRVVMRLPTVPYVPRANTHLPSCILRNMVTLGEVLRAEPHLTRRELMMFLSCPCSPLDDLLGLGRRLGIIPQAIEVN